MFSKTYILNLPCAEGGSLSPHELFKIAATANATFEERDMEQKIKAYVENSYLKVSNMSPKSTSFPPKCFHQVNVYLETKRVTTITENPKVSKIGLLGNLGGAFSLYLGISLVALFEVVELAMRMVMGLLSATSSKVNQSS